ncbi:hypothetical protein H4R21_006805, partial [Coemansia helicoidea]
MPQQPVRDGAQDGRRQRPSSGESSLASESYGDRFIKSTDDTRINRAMGVGRCALHPCLTRRATMTTDGPAAADATPESDRGNGRAGPGAAEPQQQEQQSLAASLAACGIRETPASEQASGSGATSSAG